MIKDLNKIETKWIDLLTESCIWLNKYELFELLDDMQNQNIFINTLSIQPCTDGSFVVKIDETTKEFYNNKK